MVCSACISGVDTASPAGNNTGVGGVCPVGSYCPEATITPLPCPPGQYRYHIKKKLMI